MHCDSGGALARASNRAACALLLDFIDRLVCPSASHESQHAAILTCLLQVIELYLCEGVPPP